MKKIQQKLNLKKVKKTREVHNTRNGSNYAISEASDGSLTS